MRRGAVTAVSLSGFLVLRLANTPWYVQLAFIILLLGIEIAISNLYKQPTQIRAEYLSEADLLDKTTIPLGDKIVISTKSVINYILGSIKKAYSGTKGKMELDPSKSAQEIELNQEPPTNEQ
jgi:hypothetical protein